MEYILNKIIDSKIKKKYRLKTLLILEKYISFKSGYKYSFLNKKKEKISTLRFHTGSHIAAVCATINIYKIRQLILKYTISLTRSKNPKFLKLARIPIGFFFYVFLIMIWHIPSITVQFSYYSFMGMSHGLFRMVNPPRFFGEEVRDEAFERMVLRKERDFV